MNMFFEYKEEKEEKKEEEEKILDTDIVNQITPFDLLEIIKNKVGKEILEYLKEIPEKEYKVKVLVLTRALSMNPNYIEKINQLQKYFGVLSLQEQLFMFYYCLKKEKNFIKYIKKESEKIDNEILRIISEHYQVSRHDALEYYKIFQLNEENKKALEDLLLKYAYQKNELNE